MKAPKKTFHGNKRRKERTGVVPPPITFTPSTWYKKEDDESVMSFKLRSNPSEKKSPVYDMQAKSFASGSVEQYIWWKRDLYKIIAGQDITRPQDKFTMASRLLHGDALSVFENIVMSKDQTDPEEFDKAMKELALHIFPKNALALQKSWLRQSQNARKTSEMLTRRWVARITEINMMLPEFPPDFTKDQMMRPEDITDVLEYGIPQIWKAKMVETGFVPVNHQPTEFVEFCERLESAEQMLGLNSLNKTASMQEQKGSKPKEPNGSDNNAGSQMKNTKTSKERKSTQNRCRSYEQSDGADGCGYHTTSTTHRSNECKVLMAQAKSMRGQKAAAFNKKNGKLKLSSGDIHALMAQVKSVSKKLANAIKKKPPKTQNKRKREDSDSDEESDKNLEPDCFTLDLEEAAYNGSDSDDDFSSIDWEEDRKLSSHKKMHIE